MADVVFKVSGLSQLGQNFAELSEKVQKKAARAAVKKGAEPVAQAARNMAPQLTGALRKAIKPMRMGRESSPGLEAWAVGVPGAKSVATYTVFRSGKQRKSGRKIVAEGPSKYWKFVEFGTVKMPAQPFLRPALDSQKGKAIDEIAAELGKQIRKAAAELAKGGS